MTSDTPHQPDPARDPNASAEYHELRRLAAHYLRSERRDHTLQPTALVHEAFVRLASGDSPPRMEESRFRAFAARVMRQILVDHARRRGAAKRGGGWLRVTLSGQAQSGGPDGTDDVDLLALDEALNELAELDARKCQVVELRFFGGMTCAEAAEWLGIASKTAEADWYMARAWLRKRLASDDG